MLFGGTSAGSIVSALYAMGYTTEEMLKLFNYFSKEALGIGPKFLFANVKENRGIKIKGLTTSSNLELAIKEAAKYKNIRNIIDLQLPISIPATDLITSKEIVFTNNKLAKGDQYIKDIEIGKAVRASATFPGAYSPFEYKEYQFVDGGIFNNLPVEEVKKLGADKVMAVKFDVKSQRKQNTMYNITMQAIDLMTEKLTEKAVDLSDIVLNINVRDVKVFNIGKIDFCYEQGYKQAIEQMDEIKKKLHIK